ncbi:MAG: HD-GYP domain-containing protein [Candidatus Omnitrophota bacterium]
MALNYKKELEIAAKRMILVHNSDTLIKLIIRMLIQKVKISHAGILLYDTIKDSYVLTVSRGPAGLKIPQGFARMDTDNALIKLFQDKNNNLILNNSYLLYSNAKRILRKNFDNETKEVLSEALHQMKIFDTVACIPSYYRNNLLALLLIGKKKNSKDFKEDELNFFAALASDVAMAIKNAQLFNELELELKKKQHLFINTTIALAAAIDAKDHYTHGHTERVTSLSLEIAKRLYQTNEKIFNESFFEQLHIAGLLHDIGKIGIPESILNKQGPLTDTERAKMQEHPLLGAMILQPIKELKNAILGVKYHHEHYDGSGYPEGLKGNEIPLIASIISVADTYDAMTTDRPYRNGFSKEQAIEQIKEINGKQLNPEVVSAFLELYQENKT